MFRPSLFSTFLLALVGVTTTTITPVAAMPFLDNMKEGMDLTAEDIGFTAGSLAAGAHDVVHGVHAVADAIGDEFGQLKCNMRLGYRMAVDRHGSYYCANSNGAGVNYAGFDDNNNNNNNYYYPGGNVGSYGANMMNAPNYYGTNVMSSPTFTASSAYGNGFEMNAAPFSQSVSGGY